MKSSNRTVSLMPVPFFIVSLTMCTIITGKGHDQVLSSSQSLCHPDGCKFKTWVQIFAVDWKMNWDEKRKVDRGKNSHLRFLSNAHVHISRKSKKQTKLNISYFKSSHKGSDDNILQNPLAFPPSEKHANSVPPQSMIEIKVQRLGPLSRDDEESLKMYEEMAKSIERLERRLYPWHKWHFIVGYIHMDALKEAEHLLKSPLQHVFGKEKVKYFVTFIPRWLAKQIQDNPKFVVVEPLTGTLKIEGLTLGRRIREIGNRNNFSRSLTSGTSVSLKANLAKGEVDIGRAKAIAKRWERALQTGKWHDRSHGLGEAPFTMDYKIWSEGESRSNVDYSKVTDAGTCAHVDVRMPEHLLPLGAQVSCDVHDDTAVVCHSVNDPILGYVAEFMAEENVVQFVEIQPDYQVFNYWSSSLLQSGQIDETPIYDAGLRGEGEIIAHADTGVDMSHCFFSDNHRRIPFNSVDYDARKVVEYRVLEGGDFSDGRNGHGTHVAGSIAGDTSTGNDPFHGMAPAAKIAFYDIGSGAHASAVNVPTNLGKGLFDLGYYTGARIFCNSWGTVPDM